jgi:hypothetical protein
MVCGILGHFEAMCGSYCKRVQRTVILGKQVNLNATIKGRHHHFN